MNYEFILILVIQQLLILFFRKLDMEVQECGEVLTVQNKKALSFA